MGTVLAMLQSAPASDLQLKTDILKVSRVNSDLSIHYDYNYHLRGSPPSATFLVLSIISLVNV